MADDGGEAGVGSELGLPFARPPGYAGESPAWDRTYGESIDAYYDRPYRPRHEEAVDAAVDDSLPASDPPARTSETGAGRPKEP